MLWLQSLILLKEFSSGDIFYRVQINNFAVLLLAPILKESSSASKTNPSKTFGYNPCSGGVCRQPAVRPLVDTGAMVFVVFGILGVNRSEHRDNHVIGDMVRVAPVPLRDITHQNKFTQEG